MTYTRATARSGFSLLEIMVAIAIIGIMMAIIIPNFMSYRKNANKSAATSNLQMFDNAILMYNMHTGQLPSRLQDLIKKPSDAKIANKWEGPYLGKIKEIPEDPWGNKYQYKLTPQGEQHKYELYSYGPDGKGAPKEEWISVWGSESKKNK